MMLSGWGWRQCQREIKALDAGSALEHDGGARFSYVIKSHRT